MLTKLDDIPIDHGDAVLGERALDDLFDYEWMLIFWDEEDEEEENDEIRE